jgi:hypothetical protein
LPGLLRLGVLPERAALLWRAVLPKHPDLLRLGVLPGWGHLLRGDVLRCRVLLCGGGGVLRRGPDLLRG